MPEGMGYSRATPMDRRRGGKSPSCTQKYHPTTGGYKATNIEGLGQPGAKGYSEDADTGSKSDDGNHQMKVNSFGNYPHSGANPSNFEGPALGTTPADPTRPSNHSPRVSSKKY